MAFLMAGMGAGAGIGATLGSIATILSPILQVMGAIQANREAKEQQAEHERAAREKRVMANFEADKFRQKSRQRQSRNFTAMAEGGALSGTGLGVLDQNAVMEELDALTIEFRGEQEGKAEDFRAEQAGRSSSFLNVFSAAVSGFRQFDPLNLAAGGGA